VIRTRGSTRIGWICGCLTFMLCALTPVLAAQGASVPTIQRLADLWHQGFGGKVCRQEVFDDLGPYTRCVQTRSHREAVDSLVTSTLLGSDLVALELIVSFPDSTSADADANTLDRELSSAGAQGFSCDDGESPAGRTRSRVWQGSEFGVHTLRIAAPTGEVRYHVFAVRDTAHLPPLTLICRNARLNQRS
jgi:hypothetical protein